MVEVIIKKSKNPKKKYDALVNGKTVSFGSAPYEDFTIHKDEKRKDNYLKRHQKNEDWNDYETPGFYSRWVLWNLPTIEASIKDTIKRFPKLKITLK